MTLKLCRTILSEIWKINIYHSLWAMNVWNFEFDLEGQRSSRSCQEFFRKIRNTYYSLQAVWNLQFGLVRGQRSFRPKYVYLNLKLLYWTVFKLYLCSPNDYLHSFTWHGWVIEELVSKKMFTVRQSIIVYIREYIVEWYEFLTFFRKF